MLQQRGEASSTASGLLTENLNKDVPEGRSLVSRREAVGSHTRGEVENDGTVEELRYLPYKGRMCHGEKRGAEEQGLLEIVTSPLRCPAWSGIGKTRPHTQFTALFIKPLSVIMCSEGLRGKEEAPSS